MVAHGDRFALLLMVGLIVTTLTSGSAVAEPEKSDRKLADAVLLCRGDLPNDAPENGFAPFGPRKETFRIGPDDTYSSYPRLLATYPNGIFQSGRYGSDGLHYFVTLPGNSRPGKQFAWTILSIPRVYKEEERENNTLWDAAILESSSDFSTNLKAAAGEEAVQRFAEVKKHSPAFVADYNRHMAAFSLADGKNLRQTVTAGWEFLLGEWAMNHVIIPTHPKRDSSIKSKIGYDHWIYLHSLTPNSVAPAAKYQFISKAKLGAAGAPAFAFTIDSDKKCIAANQIATR